MIPGHASLTSLNGPAFHAMTLASLQTTRVAGSTATARHRESTGIMTGITTAATIGPKAPPPEPVLGRALAASPVCSPVWDCWRSPALGRLSRRDGLRPPPRWPLQAVLLAA